ncbi:hypothetical protein AB835_00135 [Candidatus Endobugula sertula]|uniref:Phosphate acyltransferase n=1 Tax=Candidatus Endobugula sertula TaxID=62101 RepID=A0A1D2QU80_9GAMM|nr:hypothetical protein AB835_00135 [Candidatus Endobugula sertula]
MALSIAPLRIAIDAMGGDAGPSITLPAIYKVARKYPDIQFQIYAEDGIRGELPHWCGSDNTVFIPAVNSISMTDDPIQILRHKRDSSMGLAISAVAESKADGCLSAGNTGALVVLGIHFLKTYDGIDRPALCQEVPTAAGPTYLLDMGANVDCSAQQLVQLACLGSVLCSALKNILRPSVYLLNVGSESSKGSTAIKEAAELLSRYESINYQGFIEGHEIYQGNSHVIVCDGFNGNVALKVSEGVARFMVHSLKKTCQKSTYGKLVGLLAHSLLQRWQEKMGVDRYNGAYLLGLRGTLVKSHGGANVRQFAYALEMLVHQLQKQSHFGIGHALAECFKRQNRRHSI